MGYGKIGESGGIMRKMFEGLTFEEALTKAKEGHKIRRFHWTPSVYAVVEFVEEFQQDMFVMYRMDKKFPMDISSESLLASDWDIL